MIVAAMVCHSDRRCRVGNSLKTAGDMMRRCLEAREKPEYEFVAEVRHKNGQCAIASGIAY
eukprot:258590-Amphidinium_carterae.1